MIGLADKIEPRYPWSLVEMCLLSVDLDLFDVAHRAGHSLEDGRKMARARLADAVRRKLEASIEHQAQHPHEQ